jgi:hypothetical protein
MIATEKNVIYDTMVCHVCSKIIKSGESYEKIITVRKSELIVHTDCIKKGE